jgi:predicted RNase H-like HicB family nuclease
MMRPAKKEGGTAYTVILARDEDGGFDVSVPALPGCRTWGRTRREALARATKAIQTYIESLIKDGIAAPEKVEHAVVTLR